MPQGRRVPAKLTVLPQVTVQLGTLEYDINPIPSEQAMAWRDTLLGPLNGVLGILTRLDKIELNTPADLMQIIPHVKEALLGSVDLVRNAVLDYSPDIKADWEAGELKDAYDTEFISALMQIMRLAYPLEQVRALLPTGRSASTTLPKSRSQNGDSAKVIEITKAS